MGCGPSKGTEITESSKSPTPQPKAPTDQSKHGHDEADGNKVTVPHTPVAEEPKSEPTPQVTHEPEQAAAAPPQPEKELEREPEKQPEVEAQPKPESQPEPEPETQPEQEPEPEPKQAQELEKEPEAKPEEDPEPQPEPEQTQEAEPQPEQTKEPEPEQPEQTKEPEPEQPEETKEPEPEQPEQTKEPEPEETKEPDTEAENQEVPEKEPEPENKVEEDNKEEEPAPKETETEAEAEAEANPEPSAETQPELFACEGGAQNEASGEAHHCEFGEFELATLAAHNDSRTKHGVPELTMKKELCAGAQEYAEKLISSDSLERSAEDSRMFEGALVGENIASGSDTLTGEEVCVMFHDEIEHYNFEKHGYSDDTGRFTQLIWKDSLHLGVGKATSEDGSKVVVVCRYFPAGNTEGGFEENVKLAL